MAEEFQKKVTKNRLAVFEHIPCKEKQPNSKNLGFKRNFKRSYSPSSDNELVIDDLDYTDKQPQKRRKKGVRLLAEPLSLKCEWDNCGAVYQFYENFMSHLNKHIFDLDDKEGLSCHWTDCNQVCAEWYLLKQHLFFHGYHLKLKNIGNNVLERVKLPKCNHFDEFPVPVNINGFTCEWSQCGILFTTAYEFYEHIRMHVNSNPKYCKKGETISCKWEGCSYKFSTQYKLGDHLRSHTKEKVIACPSCGSMFSTKTKFCDHRKRQMPYEMQSYQCSQCCKLFPGERLLRDHMRLHINHYKCSMCDMTCSKPSALATHFRYRHMDERPLKCDICHLGCVSKQSLETHLITHCSEKLVACDECDFRCRSLYGLDQHYYRIHGHAWSQNYECHCCEKRFMRGNSLTKHLIKEHDFRWPSGHSRFRYKEDTDGIFRLQTVRYESIEVTQEMMRTNNTPQVTKPTATSHKYNLRKRQSSDKTPNFVMVAENGEQNVVCPTNNSIVITINDVDESGNIVNSEILQSNEMKVLDSDIVKEETQIQKVEF